MVALPLPGYLSDSARTQEEMKDAFENLRNWHETRLGGYGKSELTITAGLVLPTHGWHSIDTESDASQDVLERVQQNNLVDGSLLVLEAEDPNRLVTVRHLAGGNGEIALLGARDICLQKRSKLVLIRNGSRWEQMYETRLACGATGTTGDFYGATLPIGAVYCYGQLLNPVLEPELFATLGTLYGGDGVSTFGVPDLRGRVGIGRDDMGGVAAGRLGNEIAGTVLGATGGAETVALTQAQLPNYALPVTDPTHAHGVTDGGHSHGITDPGHAHSYNRAAGSAHSNNPAGAFSHLTGDMTGTSVTGISINSATTGLVINAAATGISVASGGSNAAHSNLQPSMVCNVIMWT